MRSPEHSSLRFPTSTLCELVQCMQLSRELAVQVFLTEPQGSIEDSLGNAGVRYCSAPYNYLLYQITTLSL
jgi:hypothetical protein